MKKNLSLIVVIKIGMEINDKIMIKAKHLTEGGSLILLCMLMRLYLVFKTA